MCRNFYENGEKQWAYIMNENCVYNVVRSHCKTLKQNRKIVWGIVNFLYEDVN